ncbi:LTA synthase family protein [Streptococcus dentiloxodontae]
MKKLKSFVTGKQKHNTIIFLLILLLNFALKNIFFLMKDWEKLSPLFQIIGGISLVVYLFSIIGLAIYLSRNLNKSFISKLLLGYIFYIIVSYFLNVTRNLNNESFKLLDLAKNHFFQFSFFPTLFLIVAFAILLSYLTKGKRSHFSQKFDAFLENFSEDDQLLSGLVVSYILSDKLYNTSLDESLNNLSRSPLTYEGILFIYSLAALIIFSVIVKSCINAYRDIIENRSSLSLAFASSLFFAIVFNYSFQYGLRNDAELLGRYIVPGATVYQILVLTAVGFFLYLVVNRYLLMTFIIAILGTIVSTVNILKSDLRNEPLLVTDFTWITNPDLLISFVSTGFIISTIVILATVIGLYLFFRKRLFKKEITSNIHARVGLISCICILGFSIFVIFRNEKDSKILNGIPVVSEVNNWVDIGYQGFYSNASYKSLMYVWTKQVTKSIMDRPEGYSKERILKLAKKYDNEASKMNKERKASISDQTVIYILSESFANPTRIQGVSLSRDVIPNINQIESKTTSGLMHSDGYGGGTANMEFQTLTGLPYYNFNSSVSTLYTEVVPDMAIFPSISNQFKADNRIVIHPSEASNYSRKYIYNKLGFSTFIASNGTKDKIANSENVGLNVSDKTTYQNVLDNLDTSQNQFFSVITMQNHIPWSSSEPSDVIATGKGLTKEENDSLSSYARLLTYTDQETQNFLNQLSQLDHKVTVVFYGDHLPGLYPESIFSTAPESQYQTDYFIWSNYQTKKLNYPYVTSSDFTAELLTQTNSKVSPYYALLTEVLNNIPAGDKKKLSAQQKRIAEDLKLLQYDITAGKGYINDYKGFFNIR